MASINLQNINTLAAEKEKEWKEANSLQISTLQAELQRKDRECIQNHEMLLELKKDFKYNLSLLHQRDKELERYDELMVKAKTIESSHVAEISDLRIRIDKLNAALKQEQHTKCEMQLHFRQQVARQQSTIELLKTSKEEELDEITSQLSLLKSSHERIEAQLKAEIEAQKFELNAEFERILKEKDFENRKKSEKVEADVLAHELKCKFLEKELEHLKTEHKNQSEAVHKAESVASQLKKQLLEAENNASNISDVKNSRILELESKIEGLTRQRDCAVDEFEEKRKQLDKDMRIKHSNMDVVRKNFADREQQLMEQISKLRRKADACELETKRTLQESEDSRKNFERDINTLNKEREDLKNQFDDKIKAHDAAMTTKNVEIQNLKQKADILSCELANMREQLTKRETEVAEAAQKENLLLQSKVQLKLDWQQKCHEVEKKHNAETDELVKSLTKSRDDAVAEIRLLKERLGHENYDWDGKDPFSEDRIMELVAQNEQLKAVIEQMSQSMQHALEQEKENQIPEKGDEVKEKGFSSDYVMSLESQILHLKKEMRKAQDLAKGNEQRDLNAVDPEKLKSSQPVNDAVQEKKLCNKGFQPFFHGQMLAKRRLAKTKQDYIVDRALKSPSKAAYLVNHLQEKLAKAVSQITLLSQEKSQLLEIGNSLRSEIESMKRGRHHVVRERGDCAGSVTTNRPQLKFEADHNKLTQLEDLQYQLTRQELQFAQRLGRENEPRSLAMESTVHSVKNSTPIDDPNESHRKVVETLQYSLSTVGDASARKIWNVLDEDSPSLPRSGDDSVPVANVSTKVAKKSKSAIAKGKIPTIRNYNIKDDEEARFKMYRNR